MAVKELKPKGGGDGKKEPRSHPIVAGDFYTDGEKLWEVVKVASVAGPNSATEVEYLVQDARAALNAPPDLLSVTAGDIERWRKVKNGDGHVAGVNEEVEVVDGAA